MRKDLEENLFEKDKFIVYSKHVASRRVFSWFSVLRQFEYDEDMSYFKNHCAYFYLHKQ